MNGENFHAVIADEIDETQRTLIHAAIKVDSSEWWHQFSNVWIVKSALTTSDWVKRLNVFVPHLPSQLLVLALGEVSGQSKWAARGNAKKFTWLMDNLNKNTQVAIGSPRVVKQDEE